MCRSFHPKWLQRGPAIALRNLSGVSQMVALTPSYIYHWGDFTNSLFDAKDAGFEALILTDTGRNITEGPGFSVFAFKHGKLFTSWHWVLSGITHRTVLEIATELGLQVDIRPVPHTVFLDADDVFISSFAGGHIPIVKVDETVFV